MKDARDKLENYLRDEKAKTSDYYQKEKVRVEQVTKLKSKIQRLEEENRLLKGSSKLGLDGDHMEVTSSVRPSSSNNNSKSRGKSRDISGDTIMQVVAHGRSPDTTLRDENMDPKVSVQPRSNGIDIIQTGHIFTEIDGLSRTADPTRVGSFGDLMEVGTNNTTSVNLLSGNQYEIPQQPVQNSGNDIPSSPNLPTMRPIYNNGVTSVGKTQFVDIEVYHSSSTQDDPDYVSSPSMAADQATSVLSRKSSLPSSPEVPVVVSSRVVKKRKPRGILDTQQQAESKVKVEEILSSSPSGLHTFPESDSIDLDDIGNKQMTPRKHRPHALLKAPSILLLSTKFPHNPNSNPRPGNQIIRVLGNGIVSSRSSNLGTTPKRNDSALRQLSTNKQILPRATDDRAPKRRRIASDQAIADLMEDGENVRSIHESSKAPNEEIGGRLVTLLEKPTPPKITLSPTVRVLPETEAIHQIKKIKGRSSVVALKTPIARESDRLCMTEGDKTSLFGKKTATNKKLSTDVKAVSARSFLGSPMENESKYPKYVSSKDTDRTPGPIRLTVAQRRSITSAETFNAEVDHPSNEPLRARPLHKLNITDFKINPNYNQGREYAYTDVVRSKDARRCLQGCTKPDCCGTKFRKLAILMREPDEVLTSSQEEADEALLEEFLGGNAHTLKNMGKEEREELLLQARTRELANKHGRHRYAYERPQSPVGFWRIDFPTTQEEIEDRKKIKEREREKIEQRYREAMRPGGAYMFNDE